MSYFPSAFVKMISIMVNNVIYSLKWFIKIHTWDILLFVSFGAISKLWWNGNLANFSEKIYNKL